MNKALSILFLLITLISCEEDVELPSLNEVSVTNITNYTVNISCFVTNDGNSNIDTIGICWSTNELPTIENSTFSKGNANSLDYMITDLIPKTKYYVRAFAINEIGLSYGAENSFTTEANETDIFIDSRDGKQYKIVKIGEKWWFAENLNYYIDNSWYYNDDSVNYSSLGRLYTHESAVYALPAGWKLPTDNDWVRLEKQLGIPDEHIYDDHWRGVYQAEYLWDGGEFDFGVKWSGIRDTSLAVIYYNDGSAYYWTSIENK
jgi:uncharacterized protein (TIGR02145 family)